MARIIGPVPADRWEREVLKKLKDQCPQDWVVASDVKWALRNNSWVRSGQADAVVLVPGSGMVVLEVKGSRKIEVGDDGQWYRFEVNGGGEEKILIKEPPPGQAQRNMHSLCEKVKQDGNYRDFPGRYAFAAVYPQGIAERVPAMFDESTLVTHRHMNNLPSRIRHAIDSAGDTKQGETFTTLVVERIAKILTNGDFTISPADTEENVRDDLKQIEKLTRQQFAVLRGLFEFPRLAITGPAGSGKTLLAIWRLQALVELGKKAMYVCFNKKLAETLRKRNPSEASAIFHVDDLFSRLCPGGFGGDASQRNHFFKVVLPEKVFDVASHIGDLEKYDAIIIDEGQDFSVSQIMALQELLKAEDGRWAIFADRRQDIFRAGAGDELGADVMFRLEHNCRNTVRVNKATNEYVVSDRPIESMPGMPEGESPTVTLCRTRDLMANEAWRLASQWSTEKGVVILSPYTLSNSCMANCPRGHGLQLTESLDEIGKAGKVYFSTVRSFKGIESPAIILVDVRIPDDAPSSAFRTEDLYVGCTRPTARLALLTTDEETRSWLTIKLAKSLD